MRKLLKKIMAMICLILLTGCGNQLVTQAVRDAKLALDEQNYERAISLLLMAREEGAEGEVGNLQYQMGYLLAMHGYLAQNQLDAALLQWTELNLSPSQSRIVKDEAARLLTGEMLIAVDRLESEAARRSDRDYAKILIRRLGNFEKFSEEVAQLEAALGAS